MKTANKLSRKTFEFAYNELKLSLK